MKKDFFKGDNDNKFCTVGEAIVRLKEAGYSKDIFLGAENGSGFYYIGSADCGSIDDRSDEMIDEKETKLEEIKAKLVAHIAAFNGSLSEDGYELEKQLKKWPHTQTRSVFLRSSQRRFSAIKTFGSLFFSAGSSRHHMPESRRTDWS